MKEKTEGVLKKWDKYKYVAMVVLAGVLLMLWPESGKAPASGSAPAPAEPLQQELEEILEHIAGVGQVRVLLTTDRDGERRLAQNTELRYSGEVERPESYQRSSQVLLQNGLNGGEPMVVQNLYPVYRGALIVCQGGDQPQVQLAVTQAVSSVTGLTSDRISIAKWQSSYGGGSKR